MDVITLCFLRFVSAVALFLWPKRGVRCVRMTVAARFVAAMLLLIFIELATGPFVAQYDARPNRLVYEYLKYPREVFATIWAG